MTPEEWREYADRLIEALDSPNAADWVSAGSAVVAAVLTAVALGTAVAIGVGQIREAREARELTKRLDIDRSQPYVVVALEPVDGLPGHMNLAIRNYGQLAATDVRVSFTPEPLRVGPDGSDTFGYPPVIPLLAPGQSWSTFWDIAWERGEEALPDRYEGTVSYNGYENSHLQTRFIIDWSIYEGLHWISRKGIHEAAASLQKIEASLTGWTDTSTRSLSVVTSVRQSLTERYRAQKLRRWKETVETRESKRRQV